MKMKIVNAFYAIMFISLVAVMFAMGTGLPALPIFTGIVVLGFFAKKQEGVLSMAIQKEIWSKDIIENLFKSNEFAKFAFNADSFVLDGKVVHCPTAGAPAQSKKNLTSFPQTAINRADTDSTYAIDTYYSLPRQVQNIEKYELSYDKRQSVVGQDQMQLIQEAMEGLLYRWAPSGSSNVIPTTGASSSEDLIGGATGTRKLFTKAEFKRIAKIVSNTNNAGKMVALLTANHYHQFFESLSDAEKTNFNNVANLATGVVGMYMGWTVMMRSSVLRYRLVATVYVPVDTQDDAYAPNANDSAASLFYVDNCVERAVGDVVVFEDNGNPLYYGDVFSALLRLGGRIRRLNGVYAVVEAA